MKATFDNSVKVLLKAYLNDTLVHSNCYACAVGNLVADGLGLKFIILTDRIRRNIVWDNGEDYPGSDCNFHESGWGALFSTTNRKQLIDTKYLTSKNVNRHIKSTGYSWEELAKIEKAFEMVDKRRKDRMFLGLMAVVDVLAEIHNIDLVTVKETKELFA